ncbi:hypothetical protein PV433_19495 [Paenibacillus sp. GYB004]|uniref:hypothetical protein n=1 Tax=Paenibacillus sp. GYB004 TaxID=2994393 RepID=UPI002F969E59
MIAIDGIRGGGVVLMGAFIVIMLGCFACFGAVFGIVYRWIGKDTYEYDHEFVWDRHHATLEQMEFARKNHKPEQEDQAGGDTK